ncbi:helix-turn-helix domain-containing protein [Actinocorallia longicatena]
MKEADPAAADRADGGEPSLLQSLMPPPRRGEGESGARHGARPEGAISPEAVREALATLGKRCAELPAKYEQIVRLRLAHPAATLQELGQMHAPPLSVGTFAGRLRKVTSMIEDEGPLSRRGGPNVISGLRVLGESRDALAAVLLEDYAKGASIRDLSEKSGRSYGFIHKILLEYGAEVRSRGGYRRRKAPER